MLNRRKVSRYHLIRPLIGFIEHGEIRHQGEVVELSTAGFRFRLRGTAKETFIAQKCGLDFGEVVYKNEVIGGFGEIRYVRAEGEDVVIGFKWDDVHADDNIERSFSVIADLIAQKSAGCVNINNGVVELAGHVSSVLADDIRQALPDKFRRISLRECTSIDSSGLTMVIELEDDGVQIQEPSTDIRALLQRYRQIGPASLMAA